MKIFLFKAHKESVSLFMSRDNSKFVTLNNEKRDLISSVKRVFIKNNNFFSKILTEKKPLNIFHKKLCHINKFKSLLNHVKCRS